MRTALALIPLLALAACNGGETTNGTAPPVESATPVAAVTPPAGKQWVDVVEKTPEGGYRQGNPDAPVKLVEYGSRTCPTCGRFGVEGVGPLREKYISTGKVSYEFRDFPLHGAPDIALALLNQCVSNEAFFPVLDQIFANQQAIVERQMQLNETRPELIQQLLNQAPAQAAAGIAEAMGLIDFMKQRGVPEAKARQCLADQAKIKGIAEVYADGANNKGVQGTPTFFINGRKAEGAAVWAQLEPMLQAAGAR